MHVWVFMIQSEPQKVVDHMVCLSPIAAAKAENKPRIYIMIYFLARRVLIWYVLVQMPLEADRCARFFFTLILKNSFNLFLHYKSYAELVKWLVWTNNRPTFLSGIEIVEK